MHLVALVLSFVMVIFSFRKMERSRKRSDFIFWENVLEGVWYFIVYFTVIVFLILTVNSCVNE